MPGRGRRLLRPAARRVRSRRSPATSRGPRGAPASPLRGSGASSTGRPRSSTTSLVRDPSAVSQASIWASSSVPGCVVSSRWCGASQTSIARRSAPGAREDGVDRPAHAQVAGHLGDPAGKSLRRGARLPQVLDVGVVHVLDAHRSAGVVERPHRPDDPHLPCLLSSCDLGVQGIEPVLPERAVVLQPLVDLDERLRAQAVDPPLRLLTYVDEPGLPQHPQVPGHAGSSDRQRVGQLAGRRRVILAGSPAPCVGSGRPTPATPRPWMRTYPNSYVTARVRLKRIRPTRRQNTQLPASVARVAA